MKFLQYWKFSSFFFTELDKNGFSMRTLLSLGEGTSQFIIRESDRKVNLSYVYCNLKHGCQLIVHREGAHALKSSTHLVKRAHALMSTYST